MGIQIPEIARQLVTVDVDKHFAHLPNCSCPTPGAEEMFNDHVLVETVVDGGKRALRFQFQSEVGGPFGGPSFTFWGRGYDFFAPYAIYLNENGELYLRRTPLSFAGTHPVEDAGEQLRTDELSRMVVMVTSALGCVGTAHDDFALIALAQSIDAAAGRLSTVGGELPKHDQVAAQVISLTVETTREVSPYTVQASIAQSFCNWDDWEHFSFLGCLGASGAGL